MKKKVFCIFVITLFFVSFCFIDNDDSTTKVISYNGNNLRISIDGRTSNTLPTSGTYYLTDYTCKSDSTEIIWNKSTYKLYVSNGTNKGDISCYLEFKSAPLLSEVPVGSYVKYTGTNGCEGNSCDGYNANYVSDTDMGYCRNGQHKFFVNGWRIGYVENRSAHLVSAGAPECMCSNSDGSYSNSSCSTYLSSANVQKHYKNMNNISLKYCNKNYANGGICDENTVWAMNAVDFHKITGSTLSSSSCYTKYSSVACGYTNDLIDNGSYYWFATPYSSSGSSVTFYFSASNRGIGSQNSWGGSSGDSSIIGVRPVLKLEPLIKVVGGSGTYEDPYIISNNSFEIADGANYLTSNDDLTSVSLAMNRSSDVSTMCVSVDTSVCTNYVTYSDTYTLDMSGQEDGEKVVYVYYKNSYDDVVASMSKSIVVDTTAPTNNSVSINEGTDFDRTLTLSSTGASYMCFSNTNNSASDCTSWVDYATTYSWTLSSGYGTKTVYAFFKDTAGNISSAVSNSVVIEDSSSSTTADYKYWMDAYSPSSIYLMRSDGATSLVSNTDSSVTWYGEDSVSMNICVTDNTVLSSLDNQVWCIGNDNNIYSKTISDATWTAYLTSNSIDVNTYSYSIYFDDSHGLIIVRNDGLINYLYDGEIGGYWDWGSNLSVNVCDGTGENVYCLGSDGYYYYSTSFVNPFSGGTLSFPVSSSSWIDATRYNNTAVDGYVSLLVLYNNKLYNSSFTYNATARTVINTSVPGDGIVTCTTSYTSAINICLSSDHYIYAKSYSASTWTKTTLFVE